MYSMRRFYYRNPLSLDNHDGIVELLKTLLSNTYLLYIQTQGAHWNVVGRDFPQLHELFQEQYEELAKAIDVLAEHIRTYDSFAPGSAKEFTQLATFQETAFSGLDTLADERGGVDAGYLLEMLIDQHQACVDVANQLGKITTDAIHTQNLAADRIAAHEKAIWMLSTTV